MPYSSTWISDPKNHESYLRRAIIPAFLADHCLSACVEEGTTSLNSTQTSCMKNCSSKVSESLKLYSLVQRIQLRHKDISQTFDVGEFTEMELSHKHDMYNKYTHHNKTRLTANQEKVRAEAR